MTAYAFSKHMHYLSENYEKIFCINLLSKDKPQEQSLTAAFETMIQLLKLDNVRYEFFDFHGACKNQKYDSLNQLITKLSLMNENFKFFAHDIK